MSDFTVNETPGGVEVNHEYARVTVCKWRDPITQQEVLIVDVDSVDDRPAVRIYVNDHPVFREGDES